MEPHALQLLVLRPTAHSPEHADYMGSTVLSRDVLCRNAFCLRLLSCCTAVIVFAVRCTCDSFPGASQHSSSASHGAQAWIVAAVLVSCRVLLLLSLLGRVDATSCLEKGLVLSAGSAVTTARGLQLLPLPGMDPPCWDTRALRFRELWEAPLCSAQPALTLLSWAL